MQNYLDLLRKIRDTGSQQMNRTGVAAISLPGAMLTFDLQLGFPAMTTKKFFFTQMKGELCGFLEGATSAARFRELGCTFWDANANENQAWLKNPERLGEDDLGCIYGAMWRRYPAEIQGMYMDQLAIAIHTIQTDPTNRRIIIDAWRPDLFHKMALPPCHVLYQFIVNTSTNELNLCMYQRSCDMFLGVPMNIASAALLLSIVAKLTGYTPRHFTHFLADAHIYVNHLDQVEEQLTRTPLPLCRLKLSEDLIHINNVHPDMISWESYDSHPAIRAPMAV